MELIMHLFCSKTEHWYLPQIEMLLLAMIRTTGLVASFLTCLWRISKPTVLKVLMHRFNTPYNEGTAVFNKDFTEMYFTRCFGNKKEDNFCKLMVSKRNGANWTVPAALDFIQEDVNYGHPALSADGTLLYFSCNSDEGWGGYDIWVSERNGESWGDPKLMGRSINTNWQ